MAINNWFVLHLDTTPPAITWLSPGAVFAGDEVSIPYSIDEEGIVEAAWVDYDGYRYPVTVTPTHITFTTSSWTSVGPGEVVVVLRDDVLNERTSRLPFEVRSYKFPITAEIDDNSVHVRLNDDREVTVQIIHDEMYVVTSSIEEE